MIVTVLGWRSVFGLSAPAALLLAAAAVRVVPGDRSSGRRQRVATGLALVLVPRH